MGSVALENISGWHEPIIPDGAGSWPVQALRGSHVMSGGGQLMVMQ